MKWLSSFSEVTDEWKRRIIAPETMTTLWPVAPLEHIR